jgi:hypothetical protein
MVAAHASTTGMMAPGTHVHISVQEIPQRGASPALLVIFSAREKPLSCSCYYSPNAHLIDIDAPGEIIPGNCIV